jgi:hypothetical protein
MLAASSVNQITPRRQGNKDCPSLALRGRSLADDDIISVVMKKGCVVQEADVGTQFMSRPGWHNSLISWSLPFVHTRLWSYILIRTNGFLKNAVFWDMTPCGPFKNRHFRGMFDHHHHGDKNRRSWSNVSCNSSSPILVTVMMEAIRSTETPVCNEPHDLTSHKPVFLIVTAVKTSNLT